MDSIGACPRAHSPWLPIPALRTIGSRPRRAGAARAGRARRCGRPHQALPVTPGRELCASRGACHTGTQRTGLHIVSRGLPRSASAVRCFTSFGWGGEPILPTRQARTTRASAAYGASGMTKPHGRRSARSTSTSPLANLVPQHAPRSLPAGIGVPDGARARWRTCATRRPGGCV